MSTPTLKSSQKPQHASAGKFLGFSIHENGIVIDPKKIVYSKGSATTN
jgi:hypothetical protein